MHGGRPPLACYGGGHVGFYWSGEVNRFVSDALTTSGLLPFELLQRFADRASERVDVAG
jgi:hypothetical protein